MKDLFVVENSVIGWEEPLYIGGEFRLLVAVVRQLLVVFLFALLLVVPVRLLHSEAEKVPPGTDTLVPDSHVTSWLTKEEARRLMRYHGTNGLQVTSDRVFIKRDGRWICVFRQSPGPEERTTGSEVSPTPRIDSGPGYTPR